MIWRPPLFLSLIHIFFRGLGGVHTRQGDVGGVQAKPDILGVGVGAEKIDLLLGEYGGIGVGMHAGFDAGLGAQFADHIAAARIAEDLFLVSGAAERGVFPHHALHIHVTVSYTHLFPGFCSCLPRHLF